MKFDYFYGEQSDQFSFYRIPKILFTNSLFSDISVEAKVLYGILLDRMALSQKNNWTDADGRVFIIFTVEAIMEALGCSNQKAIKLLNELEKKCCLIERKRQGLGKPNLIYVKNFISESNSHFKKCENHTSANVKPTSQEMLNSHGINTEKNHTEFNDTDSLLFPSVRGPASEMRTERKDRAVWTEIVKENIGFDILLTEYPTEHDLLENILSLVVDVICSTRSTIRVSGDNKPADVVKSQFEKLDSNHIRFVLDSLAKNTTKILDPRQYLIATLYNAPMTMECYYRSLVNHDLSGRTD